MKPLPALAAALLFVLPTAAHAQSLTEFLRDFHKDPATTMQRLPPEVMPDGTVRPRGTIDEAEISAIIGFREETRKKLMTGPLRWKTASSDDATEGRSSPEPKDLAARLAEPGPLITGLAEMEQRRLNNVMLENPPWTDSYWPLYKGMTGIRYADKNFPNSKDWTINFGYVQARPALPIFASGNPAAIDMLSPAEKYDLAMGDTDLTLTNYAWNQGAKQQKASGWVAGWMGICHGWAGAAHMMASYPLRSIVVTAPNGQPITFYPQDVKALQSMLWANANVPTRFVGSRCNVVKPRRNANGRILDPKCFDVDPATWHLSIVNQLGINRRSFVFDATYDAQVWNYPLAGYKVTYFNPQTWQEGRRLRDSVIRLSDYRLDKFPEFRDPRTRYIVGAVMDVSYVAAVNPVVGRPVSKPPMKTVRYIYDLELDGDRNIVNGEWYSNAHPDFIWTFARDAQAFAAGEGDLRREHWSPSSPVPSHWAGYAKKGSARGEPMFAFLGRLSLAGAPAELETAPVP